MVRTCPQCGQEVADLARFCSNCGSALPEASQQDVTGTLEAPLTNTGPLGTLETGSFGDLAPGSALLIVRRGPSEGTVFPLEDELITVGRADDCNVLLDDVTVSRRHAEFRRVPGGWRLSDSGSLNGTYVNRQRIESVMLAGGDEVQIGKYRFVFLLGGGHG